MWMRIDEECGLTFKIGKVSKVGRTNQKGNCYETQGETTQLMTTSTYT